jgi:flagellar basal-body rod protein FlgB
MNVELKGSNTRLMGAALDGLAARHRAIAANLANQNTPGYKRLVVSFEDQLARASGGVDLEPKVERDRSPGGPDGNNVDAMAELGQMTRVELSYQLLTRALSLEIGQMRAAISGR